MIRKNILCSLAVALAVSSVTAGQLHPTLERTAHQARLGTKPSDLSRSRRVRVGEDGRVQVYLYLKETLSAEQKSKLENQGVKIEIVNNRFKMVQAWAPLDRLNDFAAFSNIQRVEPPHYATRREGSHLTEGDELQTSEQLRAAGLRGAGQVVGIISDGASSSPLHVAEVSGDVPSGIEVFNSCEFGVCEGTEGIAMAEIVHDIAPDATIMIGGAETSLDMIDRAEDLTEAGATIIVDDLGFYDEPYFEDGLVAQVAAEVVAGGIPWASACGNDAFGYFEGDFVADAQNEFNFGVSSGGPADDTLNILSYAGGFTTVIVEWNDPWGSSNHDYKVQLWNSGVTIKLDESDILQDGTPANGFGIEAVQWENTGGSDVTVKLKVMKNNGADPDQPFKLFVLGGEVSEYGSAVGSIFGHPAAIGVLATSAIGADLPPYDEVEIFASQGPTRIDFPSSESRQKPEVSSFDYVEVSGAGGFPSPFLGTSAAAPHVAGVMAQLMGAFGDPATATQALFDSAVDIESAGFDTLSGYGRVDAFTAGESLNSAPEAAIVFPTTADELETGESYDFQGRCDGDEGGAASIFAWTITGADDMSFAEEEPSGVEFTEAGSYTLEFTCTDGFGLSAATPASIVVEVQKGTAQGGGGGCSTSGTGILTIAGVLSCLWMRIRRRA